MVDLNWLEIGTRIRNQRELLGYTRDDLADMLQVTPKFCRDIELGTKGMSIQTFANLSDALKLPTGYILFGSEDKNDLEPIINMLNTCKPEKLKYAEQILKNFILAVD